MIAKNVGIRRARGRYVLATNVDVILSDELMRSLRPGRLDPQCLYRADRHDVDIRPQTRDALTDLLTDCRDNVVRICRRTGTHDLRAGTFYPIYDQRYLPLWLRMVRHFWWAITFRVRSAIGRLVLLSKRVAVGLGLRMARTAARGRGVVRRLIRAPRTITRRRARKLARHPLRFARRALAQILRSFDRGDAVPPPIDSETRARWRLGEIVRALSFERGKIRKQIAIVRELHELELARLQLHTNASGDFTLLSHEAWLRSGGYAELEMFSMHIDGLFLYQAHYSGLLERVLPGALFHIEHTQGFKPDPDEVASLNSRLEQAAIPQITGDQFMSWVREMYRTQGPLTFNGPDWGMAREELVESTPNLATVKAIV